MRIAELARDKTDLRAWIATKDDEIENSKVDSKTIVLTNRAVSL
jgi:hypothetical protein